jgi:hypothetical protein
VKRVPLVCRPVGEHVRTIVPVLQTVASVADGERAALVELGGVDRVLDCAARFRRWVDVEFAPRLSVGGQDRVERERSRPRAGTQAAAVPVPETVLDR